MPKTQSVALHSHFAQRTTTLATLWKVTLVKYQPWITAITKANPGVVTTRWAHGLTTGDTVKLYNVGGMTQANGNEYLITVVSPTTFSIGVNTTGFSTFVAGTSPSTMATARRVLGFTDHVSNLTLSNVIYGAAFGYSATAIKNSSDLSIDNLDLIGVLDSDAITAEDIALGKYDNAEIEISQVNYRDLSQGKMILRRGNIGEVRIHRSRYMGELRGLLHYYAQNVGQLYQAQCRADLGDLRCKVRLNPPAWTVATAYTVRTANEAGVGSVVRPTTPNGFHFKRVVAGASHATTEPTWNAVLDGLTDDNGVVGAWQAIRALTIEGTVDAVDNPKAIFTAMGFDDETNWYRFGLLTWITGANIGISIEVKESTQEGYGETTFELFEDMPFDIVAGDTFEVTAGCDKILMTAAVVDEETELTESTCITKFDNLHNFRGEPFVPGWDELLRTPDSKP